MSFLLEQLSVLLEPFFHLWMLHGDEGGISSTSGSCASGPCPSSELRPRGMWQEGGEGRSTIHMYEGGCRGRPDYMLYNELRRKHSVHLMTFLCAEHMGTRKECRMVKGRVSENFAKRKGKIVCFRKIYVKVKFVFVSQYKI